ncbi:MAG: peptidoglycan DD-metalloendopeptidase family protein [Myxococcales bacterium]|nr:peptidoglycan DD-metalloendopeptidase family protein [Myxococcales bacterium]
MNTKLSTHKLTIVLTCLCACSEQPTHHVVTEKLSVTRGAMESGLFRFPVDVEGDVSSKIKEEFEAFGTNSPNLYQTGLSLDTGCGKPVFAPANGIVATIFKDHETLGHGLVIEHTLDSGMKAYSTLAHLNKLQVSEGVAVGPNVQIGTSGKTGNVTTCRLHMRVGATPEILPEYVEYVPSTIGFADPVDFMFGSPSEAFDLCTLTVTSETPLTVDDWSPCFARGGDPTLWAESLDGLDEHGWLSTVSVDAPPFGEWRYSVMFDGNYTISAYIGPMQANHPKARFVVYHDDGETEVVVNQHTQCGNFVELAHVTLTSGKTYKVRLDTTEDIDGAQIGFDAIKVELNCAFEYATTCVGNQVFWKDSCGNLGTFLQECNDANECTTDYCTNGICQYTPESTGFCNDGSECTKDDKCVTGKCVGGPFTCDDGNPCTTDYCFGNKCNYAFASAACDDGNICTEGEFCANGTCIGGTLWSCDDDDPCTLDTCDPETGECIFEPAPAACDGRECGVDVCGNSCGGCQGGTACSSAGQCVTPCSGRPGPRCVGNQLYFCGDDDDFVDCGALGGFCGIDRNNNPECQFPPREGEPFVPETDPSTKVNAAPHDYLWPTAGEDNGPGGCSGARAEHAYLGNILLFLGLMYLVWMRKIVRPHQRGSQYRNTANVDSEK